VSEECGDAIAENAEHQEWKLVSKRGKGIERPVRHNRVVEGRTQGKKLKD